MSRQAQSALILRGGDAMQFESSLVRDVVTDELVRTCGAGGGATPPGAGVPRGSVEPRSSPASLLAAPQRAQLSRQAKSGAVGPERRSRGG